MILLTTTLSIIWAQSQLEEQYGDVQVNPAPERTAIDFGRIADGYPLTDLRVCVPSGLAPVSLFTSILGGSNETYYIAPGGSFERLGLRRSYWQIRGQGFSQNPSRFYLVGRTLFELRYRNKLPEASREILRDFYGWNQQPYPVQMNYLSFLIQRSHARLALNQGNWTVSVEMHTRLCHNDQNASLGEGCSGVVGAENCADILGRLQINRTSSNPGANCSTGACYWFDPASRYGDMYHRLWRAGTVSLNLDWDSNDGNNGGGGNNRRLASVQTSPSGATVECNRIQLTPDNDNWVRLFASSDTYKGLILMRRRAFADGTRSLDPLGIPELGENELVFRETPSGVQLKTALSAWMLADPPESFLLRIPFSDGGELVLADQVEWFAYRLFWATPNVPFQISWNRYGYAPNYTQRTVEAEGESVSLGKIFIWTFAEHNASRLPDYNPALNTNVFGKQEAQMQFRPTSNSSFTVVGKANYEVFFPVLGTRCPQVAPREPAGITVPNWFHYYWRAVGSPNNVVFTNQGSPNTRGFYIQGQPHVYICSNIGNCTTTTFPLFARRWGQCPQGVPRPNVVTHVDTLTIYGIHCFAHAVYHELGHKSSYETYWGRMPIYGARFRSGDSDGDGLLDDWEEAHGLCPYLPHTTDAYSILSYPESSDQEVVADVIAYNDLLNAEMHVSEGQWRWRLDGLRRHDWSNFGLQYGDPTRRFDAFPWKYSSSGRNTSNYSDLLIGWTPIR